MKRLEKGSNIIESIRDDGYVIYEPNWNRSERNEVGFLGKRWYSDNGRFCAHFVCDESPEVNLALVDIESDTIMFRTKLNRPHNCRVSNEGVVVCENWRKLANWDLYVFNKFGEVLIKKSHKYGMGEIFEFIEHETKFRYDIGYTGKINTLQL